MDARELAQMVRQTRDAQKSYFRSRTPAALELSKRLEALLDDAVRRVLEGRGLFDPDGEEGE